MILLRYLQGLSLRELASIEASSEEAVRKRVSRALERLAALLARQGVTASAMMGCLTHVPLWPVPPPAGIATRAAKEAASASASAGFAALLVSCMPLVTVFLAVAIPAALPWGAAAPVLGDPPDTTLMPIGAMEPERTPPAGKRPLTPAVMAGLRRELSSMRAKSRHAQHRAVRQRILDRIGRIGGGDFLETYIDPFRWAAIQSLITDLPVDEIRSLAATLLQERDGHFIAETVFTRWTELAPEEARKAALEHMAGSGDYRPLLGTLRVMARGDFAGVLRWAKGSAPEFCRDDILLSLIQPLAAADPRAYVKWSTDPSTSPGKSKVNTVGAPPPSPGEALYGVLPYDTSFALNGLRQGERDGSLKFPVSRLEEDLAFKGQLKPSHAETMEAFARDLPGDSALRGQLLIIAAITLADSQPARAADLLTAARPDSGEPDGRWLGMMGSLLRDWQDRDMPSALDWLAAHPDLNLDPDTLSGLVRRNRLRMPEKTKSSPVVTP